MTKSYIEKSPLIVAELLSPAADWSQKSFCSTTKPRMIAHSGLLVFFCRSVGTLHFQLPQPLQSTTVIRFTVPEAGTVSLKVFDLLGRGVATLVNKHRVAGAHQVLFDASALPSGVYFLQAGISWESCNSENGVSAG